MRLVLFSYVNIEFSCLDLERLLESHGCSSEESQGCPTFLFPSQVTENKLWKQMALEQ